MLDHPAPAIRFFAVAVKLPMDLQMILWHRVVGSMKQNILHKDSEAAFKSISRILHLPPQSELSVQLLRYQLRMSVKLRRWRPKLAVRLRRIGPGFISFYSFSILLSVIMVIWFDHLWFIFSGIAGCCGFICVLFLAG